MKTFIKTICGISCVFHSSPSKAREVNYKALNTYILNLNKCNEIQGVFEKTSQFLSSVFYDKLCGFAFSQIGSDDIWVEPVLNSRQLQKLINMKGGDKTKLKIHYHDEYSGATCNGSTLFQNSRALYDFSFEKYGVGVYILTKVPVTQFMQETLHIIAQAMGSVLANINKINHLENTAAMDQLTGCYNRWGFERLINHDIESSHRYKRDLSVIMFDIDHFKKINDTFGHQSGDEVLKKISELSVQHIRQGDYLARIGGEEFVVVLPETKLSKAIEIAERLRKEIDAACFNSFQGECIAVSASFGVASVQPGSDIPLLLKEADMMLYKAKNSGRNRVMPM